MAVTGWWLVGSVVLVLSAHPPPSALQSQTAQCLACHGVPGMTMTLGDDTVLDLFVDEAQLAASVHAGKLGCSDCHRDISEYPHPPAQFRDRRSLSLALYESCKRCHFLNYTRTIESVHFNMLARGHRDAPVCTDCHDAHAISDPYQPRAAISQRCARCHQSIYEAYVKSVHGRALVGEGNPDVPVCTGCHRAHDIEDPRTASFKLHTPQLCGDCHGDEKLMQKYGISTQVLRTYLSDFHGMTASLLGEQTDLVSIPAVCTDCHGVHDIRPAEDPASLIMRDNLVKACRKCHPGASANFPAAWLSHYEPSPEKAPLVYYLQQFYRFFIPFVGFGLLLQILLSLWRLAVNR